MTGLVEGIVGDPEMWAEDPVAAGAFAVTNISSFFIPVAGAGAAAGKVGSVAARLGTSTVRLGARVDGAVSSSVVVNVGELLARGGNTLTDLGRGSSAASRAELAGVLEAFEQTRVARTELSPPVGFGERMNAAVEQAAQLPARATEAMQHLGDRLGLHGGGGLLPAFADGAPGGGHRAAEPIADMSVYSPGSHAATPSEGGVTVMPLERPETRRAGVVASGLAEKSQASWHTRDTNAGTVATEIRDAVDTTGAPEGHEPRGNGVGGNEARGSISSGPVIDAPDGRVYSMMDGADHASRYRPDQLWRYRITEDLLNRRGGSRSEFINLVNKPLADLRSRDRSISQSVSSQLVGQLSPRAVFQKALDPARFELQRYGESRTPYGQYEMLVLRPGIAESMCIGIWPRLAVR